MNETVAFPQVLSVVSPPTYVDVEMGTEDRSYNFVPKHVFDHLFSIYWFDGLLKAYLSGCPSETVVEGLKDSTYDKRAVATWENWVAQQKDEPLFSFSPLPLKGESLQVHFLGDSYMWTTNRRDGSLANIINEGIKMVSERNPPKWDGKPGSWYQCYFSFPHQRGTGDREIDFAHLARMLRTVFGLKGLNGQRLASSVVENFLHDRCRAVNLGTVQHGSVNVSCGLTAKHAFTKEEHAEFGRPWEIERATSRSFDDRKIRGSIGETKGSVVYFPYFYGNTFPPELRVELYVPWYSTDHYKGAGIEGGPLGALAVQRWVREVALPRFGLEVMKLHIPQHFPKTP